MPVLTRARRPTAILLQLRSVRSRAGGHRSSSSSVFVADNGGLIIAVGAGWVVSNREKGRREEGEEEEGEEEAEAEERGEEGMA